MRPRKRQKMKVRVHYPETAEGMKELKERQADVMLDILESQLGTEGLSDLMEYAKDKIYEN